jgi:hypothetical protein
MVKGDLPKTVTPQLSGIRILSADRRLWESAATIGSIDVSSPLHSRDPSGRTLAGTALLKEHRYRQAIFLMAAMVIIGAVALWPYSPTFREVMFGAIGEWIGAIISVIPRR